MFNSLNILDIIFLVLAIIIIIYSTINGFLYEFFSTASWLVSFIVSFLFYKQFANFLRTYIKYDEVLYVISFLLLFLILYFIIKILHFIISKILVFPSIVSFDHALGFFLGLVKAFVIILFILCILCFQKIIPLQKLLSESKISQFLFPLIKNFLPYTWNIPYV